MNTDLSTQMMAINAASTQNSVQLAVLKKQHDMQNELLTTLTQAALSPAPAGQGIKIDKQA